jgi:hypothetical protein
MVKLFDIELIKTGYPPTEESFLLSKYTVFFFFNFPLIIIHSLFDNIL